MSTHEVYDAASAPDPARYARQSVLPAIGGEGQCRLQHSTVVIVGCGALGSVQAELAARAGVGRLILVDRDVLELHNLPRQALFDERDVRERMPKAIAAARRLRRINSGIRVEGVVADATPLTVVDLVAPADLILDGTDNFETRFLLNDVAIRTGKPWVYGGVLATDGTVMSIRPGRGPCLRCLLPQPPVAGDGPTCETHGVLNTAVNWVAALQVTEALKILVGGAPTEPRVHNLDIWSATLRSLVVSQRADCVCCGQRRFEFLDAERGSATTVFCGRNAVQVAPHTAVSLDIEALAQRLAALGEVSVNGLVVEFAADGCRLIAFPDGRVLVMGTTDPAVARTLVAKYLGT